MAAVTVATGSTPTVLDSGSAFTVFVENMGMVNVVVTGGGDVERLRPGQSRTFTTGGQPTSAVVSGETPGTVNVTATAAPVSGAVSLDSPAFTGTPTLNGVPLAATFASIDSPAFTGTPTLDGAPLGGGGGVLPTAAFDSPFLYERTYLHYTFTAGLVGDDLTDWTYWYVVLWDGLAALSGGNKLLDHPAGGRVTASLADLSTVASGLPGWIVIGVVLVDPAGIRGPVAYSERFYCPGVAGTLPPAVAELHGELMTVSSPGVADTLYTCLLGSDGVTYEWVLLAGPGG
jgi:hypothetical protein